MKRWIACFATAVVVCLTATPGVTRTLRTDNGAEGQNPAQAPWVYQDPSQPGWAAALSSLPAGVLVSPAGSTTPVAPTALTGSLAPSYIYTGVVSVVAFGDSNDYDAQTYPDYLTDINSSYGGVPQCAPNYNPPPGGSDPVLDYFACNQVSAVDLEWWSAPPGSTPTPVGLLQIIYFNLGQPPLSTADGYDTQLYDSTYNPITPTGTGTPQPAWELEFNCGFSGCPTGAALQYDGTLYTATPMVLSQSSITVTTPNGTNTITSPASSSALLNEFVFDGYALHAPPGWTAMNVTTTTLTASPTSVQTGQSVTLTATVSGKTPAPTGTVEFDSQGKSLGTATLSNGSAQFDATFPTAGTYMVTAVYKGDSGNVTSQSTAQTIAVTSPPPAPTVTVTVAPTTITVGQTATLTWSATNATTCDASGSWTGTQSTQGTASETPTAAGSNTYTLSCTGPGGTVAASAALTVNAPAATVTISVSPTSITAGQSATLSWSSTNATACSASGGWSGSEATSGSQTVAPTTSATYTLTCTGSGASGNAAASLTVTAAPAKSGGGGGAIDTWELIALAMIGLGARGRTRSRRAHGSH